MKKTLSYFIIRRYEKGVLLSAKFTFVLLLAALVQFSAFGSPAKGHNLKSNKGLSLNKPPLKSSAAVDVKVKGKVTDEKGESLIGATVTIKSTKNIALTDVNGDFTLTAPENATLVISYIGYQTQEVALAGRTQLTIVMKELQGDLNEVVVVGYTTQRKKDLTGAVSLVGNKDIAGLPVGGVDQILQGKAAGVAVTADNGAPGGGINIRIRGIGTINNNDPLYIVDGVPTQQGINEISPNDIESINILKDASSASIYGARASNGVVIVTTKRGKSGIAKLSLRAPIPVCKQPRT